MQNISVGDVRFAIDLHIQKMFLNESETYAHDYYSVLNMFKPDIGKSYLT